jgi:phosphoenolpyruvate-protein phosphotransferase (PTS system enzyme I)
VTRRQERNFRGIPVSPGFVLGRAFVYRAQTPVVTETAIEPGRVEAEVRRFQKSVRAAEKELRGLHAQVKRDLGADFAEFIAVQLSLVADPEALTQTEKFIRDNLRNAEFAYAQTLGKYAAALAGSNATLMKERVLDISDVSNRVLRQLLGERAPSILDVEPGAVVVGRDLPPSETALLDPRRVVGLVLEAGGKTSHTAIMAKAKELPAVMGVGPMLDSVPDGAPLFVDGSRGLAILNPTPNRLRAYEEEIRKRADHVATLSKLDDEEPVTLNDKTIDLSANIEFMAEARTAKRHGARGIGLYRTEYMYLARRRAPTEEEQYAAYTEVAKLFKPYPVLVRTFDLGGDKVLPGYSEPNPFLGFRAIRVMFEHPELFRVQARAILRASAHGNVKMMLPMVATIEELRRAKLMLERAKRELAAEGQPFDEGFELGVMVEIPSAAIMADRLAQECHFLSIGSNDLTQYTLAVDRGNERVAKLFDHFHPAVLHLIKLTIDAAHRQGIWVGLCGEFASDPLGILLLLGLGIDELSTSPGALPEAKNLIRSIDTEVAAEVAALAMKQATALEVQRLLRRELDRRFPELARSLQQLGGAHGD